ncbi:MAG TPA: FAD-dependent monooxygenase [Ktedonobacterales bacterium]|nr:FAD-dependent monooxygenase [Ktedonobacterales bacterium]
MKITILGAGPAGLYCGLLLKKANPAHEITIIERNPPDATYGWGVVFSDRTLAAFQEADYKSYRAITGRFVLWDAIDTYYRGELVRCGGHVFAGLSRKELLGILQARCRELGVALQFHTEVPDLAALSEFDLLIAADGVNSLVRRAYEETFKPRLVPGTARYVWFGTDKVLDAFTFIFRENEHGFFQVHSYPFSGTMSTFIVECDEETWRRAGLDTASEAESIAYCERLFAPELGGCHLYPNKSSWISFVTVKCATWRRGNVVLLGDSAHTAHFSIGSGTKLAMEDAIALANAIEQHPDLTTALAGYEMVRRPVVETLQAAAAESQAYFEGVRRYSRLEPVEFAFNLLTRSRRISYDDLRLRDPRFGELVDRWFERHYWAHEHKRVYSLIAPAPMLTPLALRGLTLPNRVVFSPGAALTEPAPAEEGTPALAYALEAVCLAQEGAGLVLTEPVAVSAEGRVTPDDNGLYRPEHVRAWRRITHALHDQTSACIGVLLSHAGRRGATRPRREGLDRPLRAGRWPLIAPSTLPFASTSQLPRALDRAGMDAVRDDFVRAARLAAEAGFDLLALHMGHGYLLASFLSPLVNRREDEYGGSLENRLRFPLEVLDAVRAAWPAKQPLAVALTVDDCCPGGLTYTDAVAITRTLAAHGCDLVVPLAGQTVPDAGPTYARGFLTGYAERLRNDAEILVLVGGYLTTTNEVNTLLAGGRADLCLMIPPAAPERAAGERLAAVSAPVAETASAARPTVAPDTVERGGGVAGAGGSGGRRPRTMAAASQHGGAMTQHDGEGK